MLWVVAVRDSLREPAQDSELSCQMRMDTVARAVRWPLSWRGHLTMAAAEIHGLHTKAGFLNFLCVFKNRFFINF